MQTKQLIKVIKATINKNSVLPILENVLLENETIRFTDLENDISIPFPSGVNACIPYNRFIDCLEMMNNPTFETLDGYAVNISEGKKKVKLTGDNTEDFPRIKIPTAIGLPCIGHLGKKELSYIETALRFVSKDDLRPSMTGINFDTHIVATDAHRLYFQEIEPVTQTFIMPAKTAKILLVIGGNWDMYYQSKVVDNDYTSVSILLVNSEGVQLTFVPIDAKYPQYKVVIPEGDSPINAYFFTDLLKAEIKNALKFSNKITHQVNFCMNGSTEIKSQDVDFGFEYSNEITSEVKKDADYFEIAFDGKLLTEILNELPKDKPAHFKLWHNRKAVIINDNFLLMPLMLNS